MTQQIRFEPETKMVDVIDSNYLLLPIISRFGIKLGFGDQTVAEICQKHNIHTSFFLDIINAYHDNASYPEEKIQANEPGLVVDYLIKTHQYYKDHYIPDIEYMIQNLLTSCPTGCENLELIKDFYKQYKEELEYHLQNEEDRFFPYLKALINNEPLSGDHQSLQESYSFSYHEHSDEHDNVLLKLLDLKNIIIKYLPPDYDQEKCNKLLHWIYVFERDLRDHEKLEDLILIPALKKLEEGYQKS